MMKNKKIFMLTQTVFPPDIRLEKEIKSLYENGFRLKVFCNQFEKNKGGDFPYCEIDRLKAPFNSITLNKIINFPFIINLRFFITAVISAFKFSPDFVHAHNLPMVPIGFVIKVLFRIPLIYDMHENYPAALVAYQKKGFTNKIFKNHYLALLIDKICIKISDQVIVVVKENKDHLIKSYNTVNKKITVVSNTVDLNTFGKEDVSKLIIDKYKNKVILLYTGVVSKNRGLDTPLKALALIKRKIPNIIFLIIGNGDGKEELKKIADREKLQNYVDFVEWPGHNMLSSFIYVADVCTIPQPAIESNNTTIPHKLFEYMSKGKKILVSDAKPLKRVIRETQSGIYFESFNTTDYSQKFIELMKSSENFSKNGIKWVREKYNWSQDSEELINLYLSISNNNGES